MRLDERLTDAVRDTVAQVLGGLVHDVNLVSASDADGDAAWRVLIHLKPGALEAIEDDQLVDVLTGLKRRIFDEGEVRRATVEYIVDEDLIDDGDPEP